LRSCRLFVDLDPSETGQQISDLARYEVAAIQLGCDLHRKPELRPRRLHQRTLRHCAQEITAETDEAADLAFQDALAGVNGG